MSAGLWFIAFLVAFPAAVVGLANFVSSRAGEGEGR